MTIEIRAFANGDDCLVIWDAPEIRDCVGFAIGREQRSGEEVKRSVLQNRVGFKGQPMTAGQREDSTVWPFQRYDWTDHGVNTGDVVRYCVTPVLRRQDGTLEGDVSQSSSWSEWVTLSPTAGEVSVYFNRGLVMSQFMARAEG